MLWTGAPTQPEADARNAVFYGDKAIDRSPCGTGTSARMAQLHAKGKLKAGDGFVHEIDHRLAVQGPRREARRGRRTRRPSSPRSAAGRGMTGLNTIFIDDRDPFAHGFVVSDACMHEPVAAAVAETRNESLQRSGDCANDLRKWRCRTTEFVKDIALCQ